MNNYEIANRLREIADRQEKALGVSKSILDIRQVADELDPPRPESDTVVWWRYKNNPISWWQLGQAGPSGVDQFGTTHYVAWSEIEYKPARILADDEVAVKVPCTDVWPKTVDQNDAVKAVLMWHFYDKHGGCFSQMSAKHGLLTRAEAEAREAGR